MLGAAGSQVQLLGVDANPKATEVEDVLSYSQLHGMTYQWQYLTGSLAQLQSVWKAYSVGVTISENQTDHEPAIFVINQQGKLAKLYLTQLAYSAVGQLGQLLANEVSSLLPSHPAVSSHLSYATISGVSPAATAPCPRRAAGMSASAPASQARAARGCTCSSRPGTRRSRPSPASSTRSTPTSPPRARPASRADRDRRGRCRAVGVGAARLPRTLRQPLSYPVAIDDSGQVADGYGVQGVPWFVLTSADGKVIWSWEVSTSGWPSRASLDQHVRAALEQEVNRLREELSYL